MWPGSFVLIVINALIFLVHSLSPNTDWNTLRNDSDSVAQNERNLKLFLQLATHTANRLTHLRKKTDKGYDCNRHNDNPISMTEAFITQSPSQTNLEWFDKSQNIQTYSSSDDSEINLDQNQTAFYSQLQELSDLKNIDDNRNTERKLNSKMNNLIPKSIQDTSSDIIRHNHEALGYKLDSDTASNSLNANEFRSDPLKLTRNDVNEKVNQIYLKNITNTSIMDDLTETVNQFFPNPQNLQGSMFEISQRLFGTDLAQIVPKVISDVHRNANQFIPPQNTQTTRKTSDKIHDANQRFFNPIIKNAGNILNSQTADNLSIVNQILSSTKNIVESMIKILPETAKGANLLTQVIPQSQDIINTPLKVAEEGKKYFAQSDYTHQEQNKNTKHTQAAEQFINLLHNRQDLINNSGSNIRDTANTFGNNNQETRANDLQINENNSTAEDSNKQPMLLKDSSIPFLRFLSDFNEQENNNNKTETDLSSIQTNEKANSANDEELSTRDRKKTDRHLDQIDEEIKAEGFKQMNETRTDYSDEQLNPISNLSQKSKESKLTDVAVVTSTSPNQLEFSTFTLDSITEYRAKNSSSIQNSENVSDVIKSDLEEARRFQDNSSTNNEINQSTENQIMYADDLLQSNNHSLINNLKSADLYKQLSAKLQEISDRLINALRSIIEKKMDNNQNYMTDHYSKQ